MPEARCADGGSARPSCIVHAATSAIVHRAAGTYFDPRSVGHRGGERDVQLHQEVRATGTLNVFGEMRNLRATA
jgi:hypothetical protein